MKKLSPILFSITSVMLVACSDILDTYVITLDQENLSLSIGESYSLKVSLGEHTIEDPHFVWTLDSDIATLNQGLVTAVQEGTGLITVYLDLNQNLIHDENEPSDTCALTIVANPSTYIPVESLSLNESSINLALGAEKTIIASILPMNASYQQVSWLSSQSDNVSVLNGTIKALKVGSSSVTAFVDENLNNTLDSNEKQAVVYVEVLADEPEPIISVDSVTLNQTSLSIEAGTYSMVYATVAPSNATFKTVSWLSANSSIATVTNGRVDAVSQGTTTITAYVDENRNSTLDSLEKSANISITVTPKTTTPSGDLIPAKGEALPIGNTSVSGPNNATPIEIKEWVDFDFFSSLPEHWSFIMGNNKKSTSSDFYAETAGGGFKFAKTYYGLQSPLITSWLKTEVNMSVSTVRNNSQNANEYKDKPIFHIYSYDNQGNYLGMVTYNQQDKFADVTKIHFYIREPKMAYFEIRLNAHPYKSSQCYNFGIDKISVKGWNYA